MSEWSKERAWKARVRQKRTEGSNPSSSEFFMEYLAFQLARNGIGLQCFVSKHFLSKVKLFPCNEEVLPDINDESFKELAFDFLSYLGGKNVDFSKYINFIPFERFSDFQKKVYNFLLKNICFGKFITYGELAAFLFSKNYCRAIGIVLKINPFPVIIPCHRVVPAGFPHNGFGGFNQGIEIKRRLLEIENIV